MIHLFDRNATPSGCSTKSRILAWCAVLATGALAGLLVMNHISLADRSQMALATGLVLLFLINVAQLVAVYFLSSRVDSPAAAGRLTPRSMDYLVSLLNVTRAISTEGSAADLDQVIVESCRDCFDCDEVSLMRLEEDTQELRVSAFAGHRDVALVKNARVHMGESVAGTIAATRQPVILGPNVDRDRYPGFQEKKRTIRCSMVAPIVVSNRVVGVMSASSTNPEVIYDDNDLRVFCILAEHAGIVAGRVRDAEEVTKMVRALRRTSEGPDHPPARAA